MLFNSVNWVMEGSGNEKRGERSKLGWADFRVNDTAKILEYESHSVGRGGGRKKTIARRSHLL